MRQVVCECVEDPTGTLFEPVATDDAGWRYTTTLEAFARAGRDRVVALEAQLDNLEVGARRAVQ